MPADLTSTFFILDLVGVFAFGISGGLVAVHRNLDLVGVLVLACATALGGGVLRDVLIGAIPPAGISDWRFLAAACAAGLVPFFFHPGVERVLSFVNVLDAVGLGVFAVGGALKAVATPGIPPVAVVIVGVLTAVGGGLIRDVLAGQVPEVLRRELYAVPALLGAVVVAVAAQLDVLNAGVVWAATALVFGIRIVAVVLHLRAPTPIRPGDHP